MKRGRGAERHLRKMKASFWLIWGLLIWVGLLSFATVAGEEDRDHEPLNGNRTSRAKVNLIHVGAVVDELTPSIGGAAQRCIKMALADFYALHPNYRNKLVVHIRDSQDVVGATSAGEFFLCLDLLNFVQANELNVTRDPGEKSKDFNFYIYIY